MKNSYPASFKLKCVDRVKELNNIAKAAVELGISESTLRNWRNQEDTLRKVKPTARICEPRRKATHPQLEKQVCAYIDDLRKKGLACSRRMIRDEALKLKGDLGITGNFRASGGLCPNFTKLIT